MSYISHSVVGTVEKEYHKTSQLNGNKSVPKLGKDFGLLVEGWVQFFGPLALQSIQENC
jgi:hypothetical protein